MKKLTTLLKTKRTLSAEIIPPRNGTQTDAVFSQIKTLQSVPVDFISVTKGAGGSLRGGTLPIAHLIQSQYGVQSVAHFTCRDFTVEEIENALMDHNYFGVQNILALRGDPPDGQPDYFKPAPNKHIYAHQLVKQIDRLNHGEYLVREGFDSNATAVKTGKPTDFCIGVAAHPEHEPFQQGVDYFKMKVDAGAEFAITQMIFSAEPYKRFIDLCAKQGVHTPVLPGFRVVTQRSVADRMIKKFGCQIPSDLLDGLAAAKTPEDARKVGLDHAHRMCEDLIKAGAPGLHVFVMSDAATSAELLKSFK